MRSENKISISAVTQVTDDLVVSLNRLLPQLSSSTPPLDAARVQEIVSSSANTLLVARDDEDATILGALTLVLFRISTGVRAWIEDVVVDADARGRGIGERLTHEALQLAKLHGAKTVDLTSRASREAARRLYAKAGFKPRDTTVYRYDMADDGAAL